MSNSCDPLNCNPSGSSIHRIFSARILAWVAISFSRNLPNPGVELGSSALQEDSFLAEPQGKPFMLMEIDNVTPISMKLWLPDLKKESSPSAGTFQVNGRVLYIIFIDTQHYHSPRVRHPGVQNQVGLRKHHYEQSWWRWWNSSWAISSPKRWCCESAALNMPTNLENSAVATGLEKVSFHSNPEEGQRQRMFRLPHNCTHFTG